MGCHISILPRLSYIHETSGNSRMGPKSQYLHPSTVLIITPSTLRTPSANTHNHSPHKSGITSLRHEPRFKSSLSRPVPPRFNFPTLLHHHHSPRRSNQQQHNHSSLRHSKLSSPLQRLGNIHPLLHGTLPHRPNSPRNRNIPPPPPETPDCTSPLPRYPYRTPEHDDAGISRTCLARPTRY